MATLTKLKIHPSIGVARIGNHPTEYFIGPEVPNGFIKPDQIGGFKTEDTVDSNILKIKRQGARFRVFAHYDDGSIKELNSENSQVTWKVKIANTKARGKGFYGRFDMAAQRRNDFVQNETDRKSLGLEPGELVISGNGRAETFEKVKFKVKDIDGTILSSDDILLGECKTDEKGRLVVLAGFGKTGSVKNVPLGDYANNNYWFDDISDGYVKATVQINETGETIEADDAWVLCVPPKYVPEMHPLITYYDALLNKYWLTGIIDEPERPLFYRDIYPILKRAENIVHLHRMPGRHRTIKSLLDPNADIDDKKALFERLRKRDGSGGAIANMPRMFGDGYGQQLPSSKLALTDYQLLTLSKWVNGEFDIDTIANTQPSNAITPDGLDQAALENCIGGAFYPGIEASWYLRDEYSFIEPFRLDSTQIVPGDITKQMALPWQADFLACKKERDVNEANKFIVWWAYARPDDVFFEGAAEMHEWTPSSEFTEYEDMVEKWMKLGFVVEKGGKYVEVQRQILPNP